MNLSARDNFISFLQTNSICCSDLICSDEWEPMILLGLSRSHNGRNSYQIFQFELVAKMAANEQKLSFYFIDTTTCCFDKELMNNYYIITPQIRHDKKVAHYKKKQPYRNFDKMFGYMQMFLYNFVWRTNSQK